MKIDIYNQSGKKVGQYELSKQIFEVTAAPTLIHQALVMQLSNKRRAVAKTKTKAERRGGGRKPFKQKGTGSARAGSRRSPIWRKGGVIFGPTGKENYRKNMPLKQRRQALFATLSYKAKNKQILALDQYKATSIKTKEMVKALQSLPVGKSTLLVISKKDQLIQKSAANLPQVKVILAGYLNLKDLLQYESVLFLKAALERTEKIWSGNSK